MSAPPLLTFALIADVQYRDADPRGVRWYRAAADRLRDCVEEINRLDPAPAFVVQLGDIIDRDAESYDVILPVLDPLGPEIVHVLGNHDFIVDDNARPGVPARLGRVRRYDAFALAGWRFVVLDAMDVSVEGYAEDDPRYALGRAMLDALCDRGAINAHPWNGALGYEQMQWLDGVLADADAATERAILFCHMPVHPGDPHNLWNEGEVLELLDRHPSVAAWICGHNHEGAYARRNGVHHLTVPGMLDTPDTTAWATVEIHPDRLAVRGRGRAPTLDLALGVPPEGGTPWRFAP